MNKLCRLPMVCFVFLTNACYENNCVSRRYRSLTRAVLYWLRNRDHQGAADATLKAHGDCMLLGNADEQKPVAEGTVEAWGQVGEKPSGRVAWPDEGLRGRFAIYVPPVLKKLGLAEVEANPRNNR